MTPVLIPLEIGSRYGVGILPCTCENNSPLVSLRFAPYIMSLTHPASDMWWLAVALVLICIVEVRRFAVPVLDLTGLAPGFQRDSLMNPANATWFSIFNVCA